MAISSIPVSGVPSRFPVSEVTTRGPGGWVPAGWPRVRGWRRGRGGGRIRTKQGCWIPWCVLSVDRGSLGASVSAI